jgi:magnesium transporter
LGTLPLNQLLANEPEMKISALMNFDGFTLHPDYKAQQAAHAFERYALASVPVLDEDKKLIGRVSISAVKDFIRTKAVRSVLNLSGLHEEEDLFSSVWKSAKNRWMWLSLNLCFAFFASRVISGFEDTIERIVALAALMPIVAIVAGCSANQTATNTIRSLKLGQITERNVQRLLIKELAICILNGFVWGSIAGVFAYLLYKSMPLGFVIAGAMQLSLLLGALMGIIIPLILHKLGRYSIVGSNILIASLTTSGSLIIFLELANLFLTS